MTSIGTQPPQRTYDVVCVGCGHHNLIAAAYLAKARRSVALLERSAVPGASYAPRN
ncbi:hypothetical protein [Nonomuraea sp. NPDC049709]|uniref:hypothetical protein n=1 Tax=Nonomuraea sp. NPDC049709 TaxID=3154736 RepID=UPI003446B14B